MKKKAKPPTYSLLQMMMASATEPMPTFSRNHMLTTVYSALENLVRGDKPNPDDWRALADGVNMMETLMIQGHVADDDGILASLSLAMRDAALRSKEGKALRLSAQGIDGMRDLLDAYADVLATAPHRLMMQCHRDTEKRIREIQAGKTQSHDITIL